MKTFFQWLRSALAGPQHDGGPLAGVRYFYGSWQEVLTEAKRQNKLVFVDFHTIGFYPRKRIAQQAALDPSLARKFNAHFINYRVDAKAGEGLELAKRYRMQTSPVPTALFILWDGSLVYRASGYEGVKGLLAEADKALEAAAEPNQLSMLEQDYLGGKGDPTFLAAYLQERGRAGMPNQDALLTYLSLIPPSEWTTDETIHLIIGNLTTYQPGPVNALQQKLRQVSELPERACTSLRRQIGERIRELIRARMHQAIREQDERQLATVIADHEQLLRAERDDKLTQQEVDYVANGFRRRFYADTGNVDNYRPLAEAEAWRLMTISMDTIREKDKIELQRFRDRMKQVEERGDHPDYGEQAEAISTIESQDMAHRLNQLVSYYADHMTDADDLEQALIWSTRSLAFHSCPGYLHNQARLLIKLGRSGEADEVLQKVSSEQTPGVHHIRVILKRPEDYER
ncbi:thioredoxin family protein [Spirosoma utsteinense]|uniref:Thioredoxin domain-containing protein n=1 Tax=Spirosoma utsteinense TaxID=2585773 RepID=A0ABR6WE03_9BACT|nr:thioredoxin family protein [Spirosoma utsteinense]MBC3788631.1 hypothetical protein [Spirosoma utsteinense]MBC3794762.1 hypothetical protein [Spirosoma utsteinense]